MLRLIQVVYPHQCRLLFLRQTTVQTQILVSCFVFFDTSVCKCLDTPKSPD